MFAMLARLHVILSRNVLPPLSTIARMLQGCDSQPRQEDAEPENDGDFEEQNEEEHKVCSAQDFVKEEDDIDDIFGDLSD